MQRVCLDNNHSRPILPEVFEAMKPYYLEKYGNASSVHRFGQNARGAVEHARGEVAALLNSRPAEIVFTSGGTESANLGIFGFVRAVDHVITSTIYPRPVMNACHHLEELGHQCTYAG